MTGHRFDSVARYFAKRRANRVSSLPAMQTAATPIPMEPRPADAAAFLFVQSFQNGALSLTGDGLYTLTLSEGLGQTIYFSDRPDRIVGSLPTQQFLDALGFSMTNPPNAALVADRGDDTKEILIVELFSPVYDQETRALTYSVRVLDDVEQRPAPLVARRDVEKTQLVRPGRIVGLRLLHRVAGVLQIDEVHALHHAPIGYVEAWDDTDADGHESSPARGGGPSAGRWRRLAPRTAVPG